MPSTPHWENRLLEAAASNSATEGVGDALDGVVEFDTVELPLVVLLAAVMKTPPAMAGGEMVLALRAAAWYAARVAPVDLWGDQSGVGGRSGGDGTHGGLTTMAIPCWQCWIWEQ